MTLPRMRAHPTELLTGRHRHSGRRSPHPLAPACAARLIGHPEAGPLLLSLASRLASRPPRRSPPTRNMRHRSLAEGDEHEIIFNGNGARRSPIPRWFDRAFQPAGHGHTAHHTRTGGSSIGENSMRSALALGLLITLCYSADAATVHHLRTHHHHHVTSGFAQSFGYEPARPPVHDYAVPETRPPATTYGGAPLLPDPRD